MTKTPVIDKDDGGEAPGQEAGQLTLFELPVTTCTCCFRVIYVGHEATHPCFYLD